MAKAKSAHKPMGLPVNPLAAMSMDNESVLEPLQVDAVPYDAAKANPANIVFPRDHYGFMSTVKKQLVLTAGAVRGNPQKLDTFLQTLEVIAEFAKAKFKRDAYNRSKGVF